MTPPDSGERCTCSPGDRELQSRGLLLRHVKACPLRTVLDAPVPDSGEREVCECGFPKAPRDGRVAAENTGDFCWVGAPGSLASIHMGTLVETVAPRSVRLPLSLAQRILAALDEERHHYEAVGIRRAARKLEAIAAELRAHMPKEKP